MEQGEKAGSGTLIVGLGNILASDDGIGVKVVRELRALNLPTGVRVVEAATMGLGLLDLVLDYRRVIIIDAVWGGSPPGTILRLTERELSQLRQRSLSAHDLGVVEALRLGDVLYPERMPREVLLYGVVAGRVDPYRQGLSPAVEEAIPRVIEAIMVEVGHR